MRKVRAFNAGRASLPSCVGYRAPGLRTVSSLENQPGVVASSGGSGVFCRVLPGVPRSRTASGQDYLAVFLHIGVYPFTRNCFAKVASVMS